MSPKHEFLVGDEVAMISQSIGQKSIRKGVVTRVLKKYLEVLSKGEIDKFDLTGAEYPRNHHYSSAWSKLEPWTKAHAEERKVLIARRYLKGWTLPKGMSDENVLAIASFLMDYDTLGDGS